MTRRVRGRSALFFLRDQASQVVICLVVRGVHRYATHASGHQDLVNVSHEAVELGVADLRSVAKSGSLLAPRTATQWSSRHEVRPEDDAGVVVFEALGGVDAADLPKTGGVSRPERCRGGATDRAVAPEVSWLGPVADPHVADERAFGRRVAPRPAISCSHSGGVAGGLTFTEELLISLGLSTTCTSTLVADLLGASLFERERCFTHLM